VMPRECGYPGIMHTATGNPPDEHRLTEQWPIPFRFGEQHNPRRGQPGVHLVQRDLDWRRGPVDAGWVTIARNSCTHGHGSAHGAAPPPVRGCGVRPARAKPSPRGAHAP